jgi:glycosyltransferase involved in cell wall biosynthesis
VIRNVPPYVTVPYREAGPQIEVLYQGVLNPDRGLDRLIRSVSSWRPEFRLVLRGFGAARHVSWLRRLAAGREGSDRIEFVPSVPMTEMVTSASAADVGIMALPEVNRQTRYALPNKLFEYMMAGLAVCTSAAPEMKSVIDRYGVGVTFEDAEPESIAKAVNDLTRDAIARHKRRSLEAAKTLNWDAEQARLLAIYERLAHRP